jgi:hypothetical protein
MVCQRRLLVSMSASTAESTQRVVSSPQVLTVLANAANSLKGSRKTQTVEAITSLVFALAHRGPGTSTTDVAFSSALQSVRAMRWVAWKQGFAASVWFPC